MYNALTRVQTSFGLWTTVLTVLAGLIAVSDLTFPRTPTATVRMDNVQVTYGRPHYYSVTREEYASLRFSLDADISSLFTWNTKQLFVYVTAEWADAADHSGGGGGGNVTNQVVLWDQIITSPSADYLRALSPSALRQRQRERKKRAQTLVASSSAFSLLPAPVLDAWVSVQAMLVPTPVDPRRGHLRLRNQRPKYTVSHPSRRLAETGNVRLRFHYNVQPWVGVLTWSESVEDLEAGKPLVWSRWVPSWDAVRGKAPVSAPFDIPALPQKKRDSVGRSKDTGTRPTEAATA